MNVMTASLYGPTGVVCESCNRDLKPGALFRYVPSGMAMTEDGPVLYEEIRCMLCREVS